MKQHTYLKPAIKMANIDAEQLLTSSIDIGGGSTDDQWAKPDIDENPQSKSVWD